MASIPQGTKGLRTAALTAAVGVVLSAMAASAQEGLELRGAVSERDINDDLLGAPTNSPVIDDAEPTPPRNSRPPAAARSVPVAQDELVGSREGPAILDEPERSGRMGPDAIRTGGIETRGARLDGDGFAPIGIRAGSFILRPRLEQGIGHTTNANSSTNGRSSTFSETALRLSAITDWSRHSLSIDANVDWRKSLSGEELDELEGGIRGELRLDIGEGLDGTVGAGHRVREESASSPSAISGVEDRPLRHTLSGTAGISRDVARFRFGLTGDVHRDTYGDAKLLDGTVVSQSERDSTLATARLRLGYEISPAIRPFVEAEAGRRFYDERSDSAGYERSADRYALRSGVELDLRENLNGEISVGWLTERPDDERLAAISGFVTAGQLSWSPIRGTIVDFNAATEVEGTTSAGETGSLLYSASLAMTRELRANLSGRAAVGLEYRDYAASDAHDRVVWGEASLTWWMNRYAGITGRARHEIQKSNLPGRDYDETSVYLGMTFQR